jgi:iron complex transport system permease protein
LSYLGSDAQLRQILLWMLGGFDRASWPVLLVATIWILPAIVLMQRFAVALNVFTLGEAEAFHLGLRPERVKWQVLLLVAVMVGAAVSAAGVIGFVGLVVPHVLRLLAGPDHRLLLPASALLGAILLVWADLAARLLLAPAELPVGILTALIGAPFFLWLLLRQRHAGNLS